MPIYRSPRTESNGFVNFSEHIFLTHFNPVPFGTSPIIIILTILADDTK